MVVFELWDIESANLMGAYASEETAFADLRGIITAFGRPWVRDWELVRNDDESLAESILAGGALIVRALGEPLPRPA